MISNILIFSALAIFAVLSWKRLDWALMFLLAALPSYVVRFQVFGLPMTFLEGMILIAFAVWFFKDTRFKDFVRGRYPVREYFKNSPFAKGGSAEGRKAYPFGLEAILLVVVAFAAAGVSGFSAGSLGIWKAYFFEPTLLYILLLNVFQMLRGQEKIIWSLGIGALGVAGWAIIQKNTGLGIDNPLWAAAETRRAVSFFGYPNAVGLYLAPIIMLLFGALFSSHAESRPFLSAYAGKFIKEKYDWVRSKTKGFLFFIIVLSSLAVVYARSEGALIGLSAAFVVIGLLGDKKTRLAVLSFAVAAIIALLVIPGGGKTLMTKLALDDFSGQVRRAQWSETWQMLKDGRLISGAGLDNYKKAFAPYHKEGIFYDDGTDPDFYRHVVWNDDYKKMVWRPVEIYMYPHNILLNFWTELGLAGALLFIWIFGKAIVLAVGSWRLAKKSKDYSGMFLVLGVLGALAAMIVHGLVDVPYFKNDLACLFWVLLALLALGQTKKPPLASVAKKSA